MSEGVPCVAQRVCAMPIVADSRSMCPVLADSKLLTLPTFLQTLITLDDDFAEDPAPDSVDSEDVVEITATPAESYPLYSRRFRPAIKMARAFFDPMYAIMPHILDRRVQKNTEQNLEFKK